MTDLKIELARRDADIEYLEGQLAQAAASSRPVQREQPVIDQVTCMDYSPAVVSPPHGAPSKDEQGHNSLVTQCWFAEVHKRSLL